MRQYLSALQLLRSSGPFVIVPLWTTRWLKYATQRQVARRSCWLKIRYRKFVTAPLSRHCPKRALATCPYSSVETYTVETVMKTISKKKVIIKSTETILWLWLQRTFLEPPNALNRLPYRLTRFFDPVWTWRAVVWIALIADANALHSLHWELPPDSNPSTFHYAASLHPCTLHSLCPVSS